MGLFDILKPIRLAEYPKYWFRPKDDITVYEVALLLKAHIDGHGAGAGVQPEWFVINPDMKRHFVKKDEI